jgi:putative ABC transport system permease protein
MAQDTATHPRTAPRGGEKPVFRNVSSTPTSPQLSPSSRVATGESLIAPRPKDRYRGFSFWCACGVALQSLALNKTRTLLAALGVVIGVGCLITIMGLAEGTRQAMLEDIRRNGSALLSIRPGEQRQGAVSLGAGSQQALTLEDAVEIKETCSAVALTSPRVSESAQVKYQNRNERSEVMGITGDYLVIRNIPLETGRLFHATEIRGRARVCLLGASLAEELFGRSEPLDERIMVKGQSFTVIGVLKHRGEDWDDRVWVPVTTAMSRLFSMDYIHRIEVQAVNETLLDTAAAQIEDVLRKRHRLRDGEANDFEIRNQQDRLDSARETSQALTALLAGIASVSLLVGGVGIMNVMLVSVTERTREIGIRRAVGARARDIVSQFLIEAVAMCLFGSLAGVLAGFGACWVGATYAQWPIIITPFSVALASGSAVAIGLIAGLYPAVRAAALSPLVALRHGK